jgi:hypothetical protein
MRLVYYDEAGDDGYPRYSSPLFTLAAVYMHYLQWRLNFDRILEFRRALKRDFGFPVKLEMHAKYFLLGKNPYRSLRFSEEDRIEILNLFADLIGSLDLRVINVAIAKPNLTGTPRKVLDTALTFSVQRIENDLNPSQNPEARFMVITDPGRVGAMRQTTRRVQRINYIPSRFGPERYRREITALIEDPLQKDSKESYFIQLADFLAFVTYLYVHHETGIGHLHGRMPAGVDQAKVEDWMERMLPSLNTQAAGDDRYGVKIYPR